MWRTLHSMHLRLTASLRLLGIFAVFWLKSLSPFLLWESRLVPIIKAEILSVCWREMSLSGKTKLILVGSCRVGAERVALADSFGFPEAQHVSPLPSPNPPCRRVGRQRVAFTGTFPTAPLRTARESFDL